MIPALARRLASVSAPAWNRTPVYHLPEDRDILVYLPWIAGHGDKLIAQLDCSQQYALVPLQLTKQFDDNVRKQMSRFAQRFPDRYRKLIRRHLKTLGVRVRGAVFTFDWHPAMRVVSEVCEELGIERFLIPHESVFMDQDNYYRHQKTGADTPLAEHILCWGELQRHIFLRRGVEPASLHVVGAPKFDEYVGYHPRVSREVFFNGYGLDAAKKTVLFALQPMDSQVEETMARQKQSKAVEDVMDYCRDNDSQLIVRFPPSGARVLSKPLLKRIAEGSNLAIDGLGPYAQSAIESLYHTDLLVSVNSTMLFEALLMGKPALSARYFAFEQLWENVGIPWAGDRASLHRKLAALLGGAAVVDKKGWAWAENNLSNGHFDGQAAQRIRAYIEEWLASRRR